MAHYSEARERYHNQARLIARGETIDRVAKLCNTNESRLNRLLADPSFRQLIATYRSRENRDGNGSTMAKFQHLCQMAA